MTAIRLFAVLSLVFIIAACESAGKRTREGAVAGGVVGGVVGGATGGARGAAAGAAIGGAAGAATGNYLDRRAQELSKVVETKKTERGLMVTLENNVLFDFDKATLREEARKTLDELAVLLVKYPGDRLRIAGFTDSVGSEAYNQRLSKERADSVRDFLSAQGVPAARMNAVGLGETKSSAPQDQPREEDRRVEIYIQPQAQG